VEPVLRSGRPGDGARVLALWRGAGAHPSSTDDLETLERLLAEHPGALIVAVDDGVIVGSVIAGWDGWRGSIYRLAVAPSHRRHGLARRLVRDAELRFEKLEAIRLNAIVVATDDHATSFWRSTGWDEQSERIRFVKDG
jgi:ribosomal protein S18 acetylase RimI-like enzyme